jgi:DNA-binding response OmpR family regulator
MNENSSSVLIIEDQSELADLVAAVLNCAGYHPIVAADGEDGLRLARQHLPALILCDSSMPRRSGAEVIAALRADARTATLPIVMMSGHSEAELACCGADALLTKPFQMKEMLDLARSFLRENPSRREEPERELAEAACP